MEFAVAWSAIGLLAASLFGSSYYLGSRIDALAARLDSRIDRLDSSLSGRIDGLSTRIDLLSESLTAHLRRSSH
jgi:hypothetical protein